MKVIGKSNVYIISFAEPIPTSRSTTKGEFYLLFSFCFILERRTLNKTVEADVKFLLVTDDAIQKRIPLKFLSNHRE